MDTYCVGMGKSWKKLQFLILLTPDLVEGYDNVYMLGDEIKKSPLIRLWEKQYGVQFTDYELPPRHRAHPVNHRVEIRYFIKKGSFSKHYCDGVNSIIPVEAAFNYVRENTTGLALVTTNEEFKGYINETACKFITPRATGSNDYQDHTTCFWGAAMKVSPAESKLVSRVTEMKREEQVEWREHNAMYQFVCRTNVRVYQSSITVIMYVMDAQQAKYLSGRFDNCPYSHIDIGLPDGKAGAPVTVNLAAMTDEEKKAHKANLAKAAYVASAKIPKTPEEQLESKRKARKEYKERQKGIISSGNNYIDTRDNYFQEELSPPGAEIGGQYDIGYATSYGNNIKSIIDKSERIIPISQVPNISSPEPEQTAPQPSMEERLAAMRAEMKAVYGKETPANMLKRKRGY